VKALATPKGLEAMSIEGDREHVVLALPLPEWQLPSDLTGAEREVALLMLAGLRGVEIARMRGTSVRTVANQTQAVYRKAGVRSLRGLAERCARR